ncbi:XRE family transcriptional regulator [[Eubacterium] hominis]|uniref:XRE family transcriptional regulator n=1 Tax=[Eubacterium] hominis TaxID=2764325 RepID=UPI003A4E05EC
MFGDKLKESRIACNLSQTEFAKMLAVKNTTISNWELGISKPDIIMLEKICILLNLQAEYFFESTNQKEPSLNTEELEYLKKFRKLDIYGKKQVKQVIDNESLRVEEQLLINEKRNEKHFNMVAKTEYLTGLSAGSGLFIFDDIPSETIMIPKEYDYIDFVISVSGDSMEPTYLNGDKVMVIKQNQINCGEIGVFMIDGNGYIKELCNQGLLSHNPKYPMIKFNEGCNIYCIGKVIKKI